jgi:putative NADH-flavin reductase
MKIAVFGSTGFVGKVLVRKALSAGYQIRTLVRNPEKLGDLKDRVEFIQGNFFDPSMIDTTISGTEAVLSTVCLPPGLRGDTVPYHKAMQHLVEAMKLHGIKRLIHIGGAVHPGGENEIWTRKRRFLRVFLNLLSKPVLIAKQQEWEVLKSSDLDWTLVRPPRITRRKATGILTIDEKNLKSLKVSVEDLTDFMIEQISARDWIRKAPLISS